MYSMASIQNSMGPLWVLPGILKFLKVPPKLPGFLWCRFGIMNDFLKLSRLWSRHCRHFTFSWSPLTSLIWPFYHLILRKLFWHNKLHPNERTLQISLIEQHLLKWIYSLGIRNIFKLNLDNFGSLQRVVKSNSIVWIHREESQYKQRD